MNVKIPLGLGHSDRLSDLQTGSKFRKLGGEFSWKCAHGLLEEKCYHTVFKVFRGLLFAFFLIGFLIALFRL